MTTPTETAAPVADRGIRLKEVMARVGLKKTTIYARIKVGTFPAPKKDGAVSIWSEAQVQEYLRKLFSPEGQV